MAFCKGGLAAVRNIVKHIDDVLEKVIEEITIVTGKIKALEANPTVEAIIAFIPGGSAIEGFINKGIDELTGVVDDAKSVADKILEWLGAFKTESEKNAGVFKLASLAAKAADSKPAADKTESFYDSAVQLHIMSVKEESKD